MLKGYTRYLCLTKSFFGGFEPATIEDFRDAVWKAEGEGGDPDGHIANWLRNGSIVVTLGDIDYRSVTEWTVADAAMLMVAANQGNMIDGFREYAKDATDEDVWAVIKQVSDALESKNMNDAIIAVNAVAQFFGIAPPRPSAEDLADVTSGPDTHDFPRRDDSLLA